jgi:hypothetical protein
MPLVGELYRPEEVIEERCIDTDYGMHVNANVPAVFI